MATCHIQPYPEDCLPLPNNTCVDTFNNEFKTGSCSTQTATTACCGAVRAMGGCFDSIVSAMEREPEKYGKQAAKL